ncbi:ABC transporter permease [Allorhodopirellula heiligendammensis]|uniref:Ribose transport system permease protein RbsC n=1 Tax=Allorhodopirellula heiligendammensis TaxID=2714739 RepID=A0A5C6C3M6_9BACT|nr:ribose ABC transporter permease [Allorhodopirellula heiligendammensis]TWU18758.1 Ribose transport system permease protein RbsC [Allorhodopirellula heiligendammensis]
MRDNSQFWQLATRFQSLLVLVLMIVTMSLLSDRFLTQANGLNIMRQISVNVCLSIGMTMVILSGGIDLSVGSVLAFSGAITAGLIKSAIPMTWLGVEFQFTTGGAILAGLSVGVLLGWFNGQMITRLKIPPFVATLGMLSIARGMTMLWTKGFPITGLGDGFAFIGTGSVLGLPVPVWVAASLVGLSALFTKKMKLGRYIYAVGGNEQTARLSGLNVNRIKVIVYTLAGALSAVAGLIMTSRLDSAQPNAGTGYELDSIAAVVIGGTSLSGGRGSIIGTVIGCLIIGVLNSGLVLLNVSPFWQQVVKGGVILTAVAIDRMREPRE